MNSTSSALTVLSAIITPAVLISACGTMILSTSNRLTRVIDQVRDLSERFEKLVRDQTDQPASDLDRDKHTMIFEQLIKMTHRARLLQRSMAILYLAISTFVASSVAIGIVAIVGFHLSWIPSVLALAGTGLLFYGSVLLIIESRLALLTTYSEMDFLWRMGQQYAPADFLKHQHRTGFFHRK